ncbi:MAG: hypothetical protein M0Q91_15115 [Methanoregula sp.]|jgi:hypothetical protein|nr:hypothetical protein [Methanoregula sp.]
MEPNGKTDSSMSKATLKIEDTTRDKLKALSIHMDDTFDTIICRLIAEHEEHKREGRK